MLNVWWHGSCIPHFSQCYDSAFISSHLDLQRSHYGRPPVCIRSWRYRICICQVHMPLNPINEAELIPHENWKKKTTEGILYERKMLKTRNWFKIEKKKKVTDALGTEHSRGYNLSNILFILYSAIFPQGINITRKPHTEQFEYMPKETERKEGKQWHDAGGFVHYKALYRLMFRTSKSFLQRR